MKEDVPAGTVTFLFTDLERSTRLMERLGDRFDVVLADQRRILGDAAADHGGSRMETEGDACSFAFSRATDAVAAALEAQLGIRAQVWPGEADVRVRMGIHVGEARIGLGTYIGLPVHKAQRICTAGHGGQILLSAVTKELAEDGLPADSSLADLGEHRLKDLSRPERIHQLLHPALDPDFPPLRTLDLFPNNLPAQLASFIGREAQIEEVRKLIASARLVTLTGPGGAGKTRLALQSAAEALDGYPQGAWIVDLAGTLDGSQAPLAVASNLGLREAGGAGPGQAPPSGGAARSAIERIVGHLRPSTALLILDNCEHIVSSCAEMGEALVAGCPKLTILATSREPLGVQGEVRWVVPPLSLPVDAARSLDEVADSEAVRLFIDRAALNQTGFALTAENAPAIVDICRRLDGMPLAIELAAAWVHALSPQQILARLDDQFRLLASTVRRPARHETLRAAVDWSYDLLTPPERRLLENLAIFSGGFTLEGAERVCAGGGVTTDDVLPLLSSLINKSLVIRETESVGDRYRLLEAIRQYGWDKLLAPAPDADDHPTSGAVVFRREGDYWTIGHPNAVVRLKHSKGLGFLHVLLSRPGREFHVLDLAGGGPDSDAGEILDPQARAAYKQRLADLDDDLEEAHRFNDAERAAKAQSEIDAVAEQLAGAVGLGGRNRLAGSAAERARMSVGKAIRGAVDRIEKLQPELGRRLQRSVRTGMYCSYNPETGDPSWSL